MIRTIFLTFLTLLSCSFTACGQTLNDHELQYLVREPLQKSSAPDAIILLHGYGSNEGDLFSLASQLPGDMLVVSAKAPYTIGENSFAWFHISHAGGKKSYAKDEEEKSRNAITSFIGHIKTKYHVSRVFLMGFSQGAIMSYGIAFTQPEKIDGIIALSGRLLPDIHPAGSKQLAKLSVFIGHGSNDQVLILNESQAAAKQFRELGVATTFKTYDMAHQISAQEMRDILDWLAKETKR